MKSEDIVLSVVCTTYCHEPYMRKALDSILMQKTNFKFEVLIGEDCSPDDSRTILKEYEAKYPDLFHMYYRNVNLKQTKNMYELLMDANGKYIATLELDDLWIDEYKLQKQVDLLEEHPEYIGTANNFDVIDINGNVISSTDNQRILNFLGKSFSLDDFLENGFVFQTAGVCYRNIWKENKDYSIIYKSDKTVVDLTAYSMLLKKGNFYIFPEKMSAYRLVISDDAVNARSIGKQNIPLDLWQSSCQLYMLNQYFHKEIDYSGFWHRVVFDYLKGIFRKEDARYRWNVFLKMFIRCSGKTKKMVCQSFLESVGRKIKRQRK